MQHPGTHPILTFKWFDPLSRALSIETSLQTWLSDDTNDLARYGDNLDGTMVTRGSVLRLKLSDVYGSLYLSAPPHDRSKTNFKYKSWMFRLFATG